MLVPHGKSINICAVPRDVVEVTLIALGTARAASSSGSVTSTSICCTGIVPLSTLTRSRGNDTIGNNSTGKAIAA